MAFADVEKEMAKKTLKHYCSKWKELRYDEIHNKPYFIGKRNKDSTSEILFPVDCYKAMTFSELKASIIDSGTTCVNLAVYSCDSTVALYKAELGLKPRGDLKEKEIIPEHYTAVDDPSIAHCSESANKSFTTFEHTETGSNSDCLQIDLQADDSQSSDTKNDDSNDSDSCNESDTISP